MKDRSSFRQQQKKTPAKTRKNSILRTKKKVTQKGLVKESLIRHRKGVACQKQKGRLVKTNEIMSNYLLNIYFVHWDAPIYEHFTLTLEIWLPSY